MFHIWTEEKLDDILKKTLTPNKKSGKEHKSPHDSCVLLVTTKEKRKSLTSIAKIPLSRPYNFISSGKC